MSHTHSRWYKTFRAYQYGMVVFIALAVVGILMSVIRYAPSVNQPLALLGLWLGGLYLWISSLALGATVMTATVVWRTLGARLKKMSSWAMVMSGCLLFALVVNSWIVSSFATVLDLARNKPVALRALVALDVLVMVMAVIYYLTAIFEPLVYVFFIRRPRRLGPGDFDCTHARRLLGHKLFDEATAAMLARHLRLCASCRSAEWRSIEELQAAGTLPSRYTLSY